MNDKQQPEEFDDDDDCFQDGGEFIPCDRCDGHDACEDFGCAFKLGLGHLVEKDSAEEW